MNPVGSYRSGRVAEQMKKELADIIRNEIKDPRVGFVTVTSVEISPDLRYAKAFISVLGPGAAADQSLQALNRAVGFIRSEIGRRIRLRHTPEITFKLDQSLEHGIRISRLLNELERQPDEEEEKHE